MATRKHIVLGTGVLGQAVAQRLMEQRIVPLLVNRSGKPAGALPALACDVSDAEALADLLAGPTTLYVCLAPPYWRWEDQFPALAVGIARAAAGKQVDIVLADNVYAYGRCSGAFREGDQSRPCSHKGRVRQAVSERLMGMHGKGQVRVALVRGATFFGPGVEQSSVGRSAFESALGGKPTGIIGNPHTTQAFTYVPDFATAIVAAGQRDDAFGHCWHAPSHSGLTLSAFLEHVAAHGGQKLRMRRAGPLLMRCLGLFNPAMRELVEMLYLHDTPWAISSELTEGTFGIAPTSLATAIERTVHSVSGDNPATAKIA